MSPQAADREEEMEEEEMEEEEEEEEAQEEKAQEEKAQEEAVPKSWMARLGTQLTQFGREAITTPTASQYRSMGTVPQQWGRAKYGGNW